MSYSGAEVTTNRYQVFTDHTFISNSEATTPQWIKDLVTKAIKEVLGTITLPTSTTYEVTDSSTSGTVTEKDLASLTTTVLADLDNFKSYITNLATTSEVYSAITEKLSAELGDGVLSAAITEFRSVTATQLYTMALETDRLYATFSNSLDANLVKTSTYIDEAKRTYADATSVYSATSEIIKSSLEDANGSINAISGVVSSLSLKLEDGIKKARSVWKYDSDIDIDGYLYRTGFGIDTVGASQIGSITEDGITKPLFDSTFKVRADKFKIVDASTSKTVFAIEDGIIYAPELVIGSSYIENYKGEWKPNTLYYKKDKVKYLGKNYKCSIQHTSDSVFSTYNFICIDTPRNTGDMSVILTADSNAVEYATASSSPSPATITYTANLLGFDDETIDTSSLFYEFYVGDVYKETNSTGVYTVNSPSTYVSGTMAVPTVHVFVKKVETRQPIGTTDYLCKDDYNSIPALLEGSVALTVLTSNSTGLLSIPCSADGTPKDLNNTGNSISVRQGIVNLTPVSNSTTNLANSTFKVSASVSAGSFTLGSSTIVTESKEVMYNLISNLTSDTGTLTFIITARSSSGEEFTYEKSMQFKKVKDKQISFQATAFCRSSLAALPVPTGGTFSAHYPTSSNPDGTKWYDSVPEGTAPLWAVTKKFTDDGVNETAWSTPKIIANTSSVKTEFSSDNVNFHTEFVAGDKYMRTCNSVDGGTSWTCGRGSKVVGEDGAKGDPGPKGKLVTTGYVYYNDTTTAPSGKPTFANYDPANATLTGLLPTSWSMNAPTMEAKTTMTSLWYSKYTVKETADDVYSVIFSAVRKGTEFNGLVTFTSLSSPGTTTIDGSNIKTGTLTADKITTGTIGSTGSRAFIKLIGDIQSDNYSRGATYGDSAFYGTGWKFDNIEANGNTIAEIQSVSARNVWTANLSTDVGTVDRLFVSRYITGDNGKSISITSSTTLSSGYLNVTSDGSNATTTIGTIGCDKWTSGPSALRPNGTSGTYNLGSTGNLWGNIYSDTPTINTSDARKKTSIIALTERELAASIQLAKEFGTFQFLKAIKDKGDKARYHIGMTVQQAIDIMKDNHLDPFTYGFICYDEAGVDELGNNYPDSYGFRYEELLGFISIGFEYRLTKLEEASCFASSSMV